MQLRFVFGGVVTAFAVVALISSAACCSTGDAPHSPSAPAAIAASLSPSAAVPAGTTAALPAVMRTATARAGRPPSQMTIVQVQPGQGDAALKAASERVGFTIKTPGYVPVAATRLVRIFTNEAIHKDNPNVSMTAQLMYEDPGDKASPPANSIMVIEDAGHYPSGPSNATPVTVPSDAGYTVWVAHYPPKPNIPFAAVYTFMTSHNTTTFSMSLQKSVTDAQVIKMYQSMK